MTIENVVATPKHQKLSCRVSHLIKATFGEWKINLTMSFDNALLFDQFRHLNNPDCVPEKPVIKLEASPSQSTVS